MKREVYVLLWLLGLACLGVLLHQLGEPEVWRHVVMMGWGYVPHNRNHPGRLRE